MKKRVISWLLTVVMVVSLLPTSVLADTLAADQEQQTQQEQIAPVDTENTVPAENEETQEQQEPAPETPVSRSARSGGTALALAEGTVSSAKEFAAMDASGSYTLTKDIIVTEPYASDFSGTFDGNGHTVTLAISGDSDYQALFAKLAAGAVVKNVTVEGKVTGKKCVAGIAGQATDATITGCANKADILATDRYVGGIVAESKNTSISNCYNTGTISSDRSDKGVCLGGIVGNATNNTGGGTTVTNCYSIGTISATADTSNYAAIAGWCYNSTVTNCYYLDTTASAGANGNSQTATSKTADEMKSPAFAALLGDGFMVKSGDYPALSWETPTAAVRFTIAPANATLEINGGTYTGSTTVALPAADAPYSYTVSCPGYTQQTGSVTVTNKDNPVATPDSVTVTLAEDAAQWVTVTFTVTPENATLTLKDGETQVAPTEGTTYQLLKGHAYTYTAETTEEGYEPAVGTVTPTENSTQTVALKKVQSIAVTKAPTKTEYYKGDAELDLTGMVLTVKYDNSVETRTITGDYAAAGVTCEGFSTENPTDSQTVTVKYRGKTATFTIKVNDKLKFADFFTAISESITATDDTTSPFTPVQKPEGNYLESSNTSNYSSSKITLKATKNVTLSFDYLGSASSNSYYCFTVKKGSSTLLTSYSSSAWKSFSVDMAAGDTVTLKFEHPYSYGSHYSVKLKNFTVSPLYTLTIAPDQTDATVTLKDKEGKTVSGSNGVFAVKAAADYTYTVTKKGYEPATGKVTMSAENQTVNVTLVKLPVITLKFTPDDAAVTLKQGNTTVYKESADSEKGKNVYIAAKNTDYTYTVSKFGYETATGTINVATTDVNKTVKLTELAKQTVTFNITKPEGVTAEPTVTVKSGSITAYTGSGANCTLPAGDYTYTAKLDGCDDLSGNFTVASAAVAVDLPFAKKLTFDDMFQGIEGITAANGTKGFKPIKSAAGNYLESNKSYYGTTSLTLTATKPCVISFEYFAQGYEDNLDEYDSSFFTVKKAASTLLTAYEENGWKTFSTALNTGETLTLSFNENGNSYYVRLKNFAVSPAYTITLTAPEGARVVLKDKDDNTLTGSGGKYAVAPGTYTYTVTKTDYETATGKITVTDADVTKPVELTAKPVITLTVTPADAAVKLEKGSTTVRPKTTDKETGVYTYVVEKDAEYAYTVSKFGYETKTGNITVSADVNETVTLSELASCTLTFDVTPADATVTVTHPVGDTIKPEADGGYKLYLGETYAYTVAKADYITVSGSFTAAKNDTIKVTLTYAGEGWDGTTKTEPKTENGVYQIGTAAELAWFADAVQNGQTAISAKLTANINLNGKAWTAIGTSSNKFAGTLDGDEAHHYTVSGLKGSKGLFDYVDSTGKVKNLSVDAVLTANGVVGGIVDFNDGTVENCLFSGSVTNSSSYGAAGGIVGKSEGENSVVRNCVNTGSIKNTTGSYSSTLSVGGIVGYTYGKVESCYSTGKVYADPAKTTNKAIGGIAGAVKGSSYYEKWGALINCYVIGTVTGPESGIGAVVGTVDSGTSITNCVYLDTVAHVPAMGNVTAGMTAHTADYMRSAEFAVDMGMNQDDGTLNGGFPVLPWQGGTVLSADDLRAVSQAQQSLSLRGMTAADAAKKAKADWYAETVLGFYDLTDNNDKADLCKEYGIEAPGEAVTDLHDYFLTALQKHFYKELGLDAENADLLKADATGVYQIKGIEAVTVMLDDMESDEKVPCDCTTSLILPSTVQVTVNGAEMTVAIDWKSDNGLVTVKDDGTAAITAPAGGKATVTLKATLTSGSESKVKTFTLCLWSKAAEQQQTLDDIAAVITARNAAVRPLQGLGLYNDTTDANGKGVEKAFRRLLEEMGYEDVADKAVITYTDGSAKASGFDGAAHEYITANGDVKFFDGAVQLKEAYYAGLEFKVAYGGAEKTITTRAIVGRSFDDVQAQLTEAAKTLTWEMIRGENTNEAETNTAGAWDRHAVVGGITSNLTLPYSISGRYDMQVQWAVVDVAEDSNCLYISSDKDSASGVGNIVRPVRPAEGELPEDAGKETLIARVTYTDFDDDPYIKEHITGQNGVEVYADVFFDITVAPFDIDATNEMQTALTDNYQSLLVDFVDKTTKPDLRKVDADLQMPRPYLLQQEGIMTDSYNQKVTMVSLTPDVLGFNGYHAMVYRPLPGEEAAEARYVVTITTRSSGQLLARQEFSFTIQPFTKQELDDAAAFMTAALTGDVYWDGIKNENTDKTNVTSDLYPFAEICKNENGTLEYVRGTVNMTFDGIEADDIPGWLDTEKYRCFRSSRPSVIENELLRVHQPEYNTTVTLDSVLTYTKYAQYWEKFGLNGTEETKEKYKLFEQFYKQPVSVDLRVTGLTEKDDPNENAMITVTVQVDSYNENKHSFTGTNYTFTGKASNDWTAWDAVKACLDNAKYEYTGSGAYLKSITDTKGQTLGEKDDGKSSGWMFGVTPAQGEETLPNTTLDATFIHDGDTVRLFFTNKYIPVDPDEPVDPGTEVPNFDKVYADTKKYIQNNVPAPVVASDRGEWAVLGLARAGVELSDAYIQAYYGKVVAYVQKNMGADGVLVDPESHNPTVTDNERIILALTAIGKDPANVGGKNLLTALQDRNIMQVTDTSKTDINGLVFGLLALNSGNYTQDSYWLVQAILTQRNKDGSWSSSADTKPDGDVDMTAMALQALAPYYNEGDDTTVNAAVDKALQWLSAKYKGKGYTSAESCAQVVVALSALQLNANSDSSFVKTVDGAPTSVLGDLLRYYLGEGQGFKHAASGKTADQKATEQALYAMAAYERYCRRTKALYDMTDAVCAHSFGDWQVVSPATCTADGSRQRVCTRCGAVEVQTLPAAGHKFGEWTTTKEPTCTETGTEKRTCSVCSKEETRVIAALGHTPGTEVFVDKKYHWNICEVCDEAVNKTEHTYVNGIQCVCGVRKSAEGDADTTIKRVVVSDEITFVLEDNDKLNTPDKVKAELQLQITLKNSKSNKDNTVFMDVSLLVFENNEWRPATKEDLTAGKITVLLPYPEAVAAKYGQYNFTVAHMVAMEGCGLDVGTVEFPAVTKTASGLLVTLTGLSPVAISWTKSTNHYYYNPATTPDKTDSANTADDSQMVLWLGSAVLAAAAVVVLTRKKRVSK